METRCNLRSHQLGRITQLRKDRDGFPRLMRTAPSSASSSLANSSSASARTPPKTCLRGWIPVKRDRGDLLLTSLSLENLLTALWAQSDPVRARDGPAPAPGCREAPSREMASLLPEELEWVCPRRCATSSRLQELVGLAWLQPNRRLASSFALRDSPIRSRRL